MITWYDVASDARKAANELVRARHRSCPSRADYAAYATVTHVLVDMGVDGRIFPVGTKPTDGGPFGDDRFPIQVKQTDRVGRPDIDAVEAVTEPEGDGGRHRGLFVAFGYTRDAADECGRFHKRTGRLIKLLTV